MCLSDGEDFGTIPSLFGTIPSIGVEQELRYELKGPRVSLDLGRIQEVNNFVVLHCIQDVWCIKPSENRSFMTKSLLV